MKENIKHTKNEIEKKLNSTGMLYQVAKPSRYIGGEYNSTVKNHENVPMKFLLVFPDIYDIGMSHLGLKILYGIINKREDMLAERGYLPFFDMREKMIEHGIPCYGLETKTPAASFDVLAFTLQYELSFPGVVEYLRLSNIPVRSADRDGNYPIVIAGGPCAYNPEPVADFIDAFLIGDGEKAILEIGECLKNTKGQDKTRRLLELSKIEGVYVPSFYEQRGSGIIPKPEFSGKVPEKIKKRKESLKIDDAPVNQIVPFLSIVHDRAVVEVLRGCTRGCRFCHAGMVYRPVRERSREDISKLVEETLKSTGYEELSLLSLSTLDHSQIKDIVDDILPFMKENTISISIPSTRVDRFGIDMGDKISSVRKTGLTFAPEAGTQRMRDIINKNVCEEEILNTAESARKKGWSRIKLYFMAGLPGETKEDLEEIMVIVKKIRKLGIKNVSVSVAGFVPKPHTPFQFCKQATIDELHGDIRTLAVLKKFAQFEFHKPEITHIEGIIARGDRKLAPVIERISGEKGYLQGWKEGFEYSKWLEQFEQEGIESGEYTRERALDEVMPWDHIDSGLSREFLIDEYKKSEQGKLTPDCRWAECSACGVCFDK